MSIPTADPFRLDDKVAVVTGGSSGIGLAAVERLLERGAAVVFCDLPPISSDELGRRIGDRAARFHHTRRERGGPNDGAAIADRLGDRATFVPADVTFERDLENVIATVADTHGRLDVLVNNAGIGGLEGSLFDLPPEIFDRIHDVNLKAAWRITALAVPLLRRSHGSIVNVGSALARGGVAGMGAYLASKSALESLTRVSAMELAGDLVRVNCVAPGRIRTPINYDSPLRDEAVDPASLSAMFEAGQPLPVVGEPDHVADCIAWLSSPAARFVSGQTIVVDGGMTASIRVDFSGSGAVRRS